MAESIPNHPTPNHTGLAARSAARGRPAFRRTSGRAVVAAAAVVVMVATGLVGPALAEDYEVQPGDSLSVIARDNGVDTAELAAANGISDLHLIRVGQVLRIPRPEPVYYEVKPGDSVGVIAQRAGVSVAALVELNGITNPNLIRVGQQLELPTGAALAPVDPAAGYNSLPGRLVAAPERLELIPSFEQWSVHYGVPTDLLMAMAYRESGWQNDVVSHKGAMGIGQLMPNTADWVANDLIKADLDPNVPDDNIRMSARLLQWLFGYMGSEEAAIAAYYQGPGSVNAKGFYDDTQAYIDNVASIRHMFTKA